MNIKIIRIEDTDQGTLGVMLLGGEAYCSTLEPPWKSNERNISCIPVGKYVASQVHSPRYGRTIKLLAVPGRTDILIHIGNRLKDTQGCILLGRYFGSLYGERAVLASRYTFEGFISRIKDEEHIKVEIARMI